MKKLKYAAWRLRSETVKQHEALLLRRRIKTSALLDIDYQLATAGLTSPQYFTRFANRTQSRDFRDVIALAASHQRLRFADLAALFRLLSAGDKGSEDTPGIMRQMSNTPAPVRKILREIDASLLAQLAALLVNRNQDQLDLTNALAMLSYVEDQQDSYTLSADEKLFELEAYVATQTPSERALLAAATRLVGNNDTEQTSLHRANSLVIQYAIDQPLPEDVLAQWSETISNLFCEEGMEGVWLPPGTSRNHILDALVSKPDRGAVRTVESLDNDTAQGVMVSVIMPTYRPDQGIFTAVRTMLDQTHRNLELIVVDDGSGEGSEDTLRRVEELDPRITVVRGKKNGGAYAARNLGLSKAQGQYVIIQDDDDWAHSQKVSQLVAYLEAHPEVPAAAGSHVRFSESGQFIRIGHRPQFSVPCYAATMFRKTVFEEVGLWQEVRKAGDSEMMERIEGAFGVRIPVVGKAPTSLTRVGSGRLTTGELNRGYIAPARRWYVSAYRRHRELVGADADQAQTIPMGVPAASIDPPGTAYKVDYLICADYTHDCSATRAAMDKAEALLREGSTVGLAHLESPMQLKAGRGLPQVFEFLGKNESVKMLSFRERITSECVYVYGSGCAEYADEMLSRVTAEESVLVVGGEGTVVGELPRPNLPRCIANVSRIAGAKPKVRAGDDETRDQLTALGLGLFIEGHV